MPPGRDDPDHIDVAFEGFKITSAQRGLTIAGDTEQGTFSGLITGTYERSGKRFHLDITDKPWYATQGYIEEKLCDAAWMWNANWRELDREEVDERLEADFETFADYAQGVFEQVADQFGVTAGTRSALIRILASERREAWDYVGTAAKRGEEFSFSEAYDRAWPTTERALEALDPGLAVGMRDARQTHGRDWRTPEILLTSP